MVKYCPKCKSKNYEDEFWCVNCNTRLVEKSSGESKRPVPFQNVQQNQQVQPRSYSPVQETQNRWKKILAFAIIISINVSVIIVIASSGGLNTSSFSGINCKINEDFWFEGDKLITSDGWTFTITEVKDYTLDGIVLGLKTYEKNNLPYRPINTFSPIDILIGIDDVKNNPDKYPFTITSFRDRYAYWMFNGDLTTDYNYFKTHTGNNHIIPHNEEVLHELSNLSENDHVIIEGSLVNLYGTKGDQYYRWDTDTGIGNFKCEVILVDSITINAY